MFFPHSPLFDEAQEGNAGGGAATEEHAEGAGEGQQQHEQAPPTLTIDLLKDLLKSERESTIKEVTKQLNGLDAKFKKQMEKPKEPPTKSEVMTAEQMLTEYKRESEERIATIEAERKKEKAEAQQMQADAEIKSALSPFPWTVDSKGVAEGQEVAFRYYHSQAERDEDGRLIMGGMPLQAYIKEHAARAFKPYFTPRNVGGAGAAGSKGSAAPSIIGDTLLQKAQSGEKLTPDEASAARSEILAALGRR